MGTSELSGSRWLYDSKSAVVTGNDNSGQCGQTGFSTGAFCSICSNNTFDLDGRMRDSGSICLALWDVGLVLVVSVMQQKTSGSLKQGWLVQGLQVKGQAFRDCMSTGSIKKSWCGYPTAKQPPSSADPSRLGEGGLSLTLCSNDQANDQGQGYLHSIMVQGFSHPIPTYFLFLLPLPKQVGSCESKIVCL